MLVRRFSGGASLVAIIASAAIGLTFGLLDPPPGMAVADPLLLALMTGILLRALAGERWRFGQGTAQATRLLFLPGVVFYALRNLHVGTVARIHADSAILLVAVVLSYFAVVLLLGRLLRQKQTITALVATGSAVCGASAIAMI
ncbi:MAG: putative sulfate exporter family transporter, partial [Desulfuromonadales bacterium]|nr:putative sulfate exporter family transporter [Desulfuromonadales bacterium]